MQMNQLIPWRKGLPEIPVSPGVLTLASLRSVTAAPIKDLLKASCKPGLSQKAYWSVIHESNNSNLALLLS